MGQGEQVAPPVKKMEAMSGKCGARRGKDIPNHETASVRRGGPGAKPPELRKTAWSYKLNPSSEMLRVVVMGPKLGLGRVHK